jgi:hypothetical protein
VDSLQLLGELVDHHDVPVSEIWSLRNKFPPVAWSPTIAR